MPRTSSKTAKTRKTKAEEMSLRDLLVVKLKALYDVEQQLLKALPKMAKAASNQDLKSRFEEHTQQTEEHVSRIERAFEIIGEKAQKLECEGIRGIIADGEWVIKNTEGEAACDAAIAAAAQHAEYYEMAGYEALIAWAKLLGEPDLEHMFQETLDEEKQTSDTLMELSQTDLDERARESGSGEEEESESGKNSDDNNADSKSGSASTSGNGNAVEVEEDEDDEDESVSGNTVVLAGEDDDEDEE